MEKPHFIPLDEILSQTNGLEDRAKYDYFIENLVDSLASQIWIPLHKLSDSQRKKLLQKIGSALSRNDRVDHEIVTHTEVGDVTETVQDKLLSLRKKIAGY